MPQTIPGKYPTPSILAPRRQARANHRILPATPKAMKVSSEVATNTPVQLGWAGRLRKAEWRPSNDTGSPHNGQPMEYGQQGQSRSAYLLIPRDAARVNALLETLLAKFALASMENP